MAKKKPDVVAQLKEWAVARGAEAQASDSRVSAEGVGLRVRQFFSGH